MWIIGKASKLLKENYKMNIITYDTIRENEEINAYIESGNAVLGVMGYTDHSKVHANKVAVCAAMILSELGYGQKETELVKIAGYMHDIGNSVNREDHAHTGALMARQILKELGMDFRDIAVIMAAIGNHDEKTGTAADPVSAALILADKTDVRRSRVRNNARETFDIHDRVNFAAKEAVLRVNKEERNIYLYITLDETICSILDYFEIFLQRMLMCRRAAELLNCKFKFTVNDNKVL
jgi:metal-dependent HD superfamily phosphatase/phosphodiesterase